jgi:hypothetical protein
MARQSSSLCCAAGTRAGLSTGLQENKHQGEHEGRGSTCAETRDLQRSCSSSLSAGTSPASPVARSVAHWSCLTVYSDELKMQINDLLDSGQPVIIKYAPFTFHCRVIAPWPEAQEDKSAPSSGADKEGGKVPT